MTEIINKRHKIMKKYATDPTRKREGVDAIRVSKPEGDYLSYLFSDDQENMSELVDIKNKSSKVIDALVCLLKNQNLRRLKYEKDRQKLTDMPPDNQIVTVSDGRKIRRLEDKKKYLTNQLAKAESEISALISDLVFLTDSEKK